MPALPGRPRPVATISASQSWWAILSALIPGAVVLFTTMAAGQPVTSSVLAAAALAVLAPLGGAEVARRRTVAQAEDEVTPKSDPRDDTGQPLTPPDVDLKRLLRQTLTAQGGAPERAPRREPIRSMRADDRPASPPASPPAWEPEVDFYADGARELDEQQARARRPVGRASHRFRGQQ